MIEPGKINEFVFFGLETVSGAWVSESCEGKLFVINFICEEGSSM